MNWNLWWVSEDLMINKTRPIPIPCLEQGCTFARTKETCLNSLVFYLSLVFSQPWVIWRVCFQAHSWFVSVWECVFRDIFNKNPSKKKICRHSMDRNSKQMQDVFNGLKKPVDNFCQTSNGVTNMSPAGIPKYSRIVNNKCCMKSRYEVNSHIC